MPTRVPRPRGFSMMELMTVLLISATIAAMAVAAFGAQKKRQALNGAAVELHASLFFARQTALATGHQVVVMIFPDFEQANGSRGRIILYEDGDFDFFTDAAGVDFAGYDAGTQAAGPRSQVLDVIDLPFRVEVGPADGQGPAATLPAPLDGIAINTGCSFCSGAGRRGAMVFEPLGTMKVYDANSFPLAQPKGSSFSITSAESGEVRTFAVAASTGAVQTFRFDPTP